MPNLKNRIEIGLTRLEANLTLEALADYQVKGKKSTQCSRFDVDAVVVRILRSLEEPETDEVETQPEEGKEDLSTLISRRVNAFGELHLDRELTKYAIEWIELLERTVKKYQALGDGIIGLFGRIPKGDT